MTKGVPRERRLFSFIWPRRERSGRKDRLKRAQSLSRPSRNSGILPLRIPASRELGWTASSFSSKYTRIETGLTGLRLILAKTDSRTQSRARNLNREGSRALLILLLSLYTYIYVLDTQTRLQHTHRGLFPLLYNDARDVCSGAYLLPRDI